MAVVVIGKEGWTPYVAPFPSWMDGFPDGEHEVNGYKFRIETVMVDWKTRKRTVHYEGWDMEKFVDAKPLRDWRSRLDERQRKEVAWAEMYVREYNHGTVGHNQLGVIAAMAKILDEIEKAAGE